VVEIGVPGVIGVEIGEFSTLSRFSAESAVADRILRAVVLVESSTGSNVVADSVCEEKIAVLGEISLV
jgi:hypothetical protein